MWSKGALFLALYSQAALPSSSALDFVDLTPAKSGGGSPCPCGFAPKTYDFNSLTPGDYVTTIVPNELRVTAMIRDEGDEVFTPDGAARVFDSSDPQPDFDLGTPNEQCPTPGPGRGDGGVPGAVGENCVARGNLLIVQRREKDRADDAEDGGILEFEVDTSARLIFNELGILDVPARMNADYIPTKVDIYNIRTPDTPYSFEFDGVGANGFQVVGPAAGEAPIRFTTRIRIDLPYDAGIAYLTFCEQVSLDPLPGQEGYQPSRKLRGAL